MMFENIFWIHANTTFCSFVVYVLHRKLNVLKRGSLFTIACLLWYIYIKHKIKTQQKVYYNIFDTFCEMETTEHIQSLNMSTAQGNDVKGNKGISM